MINHKRQLPTYSPDAFKAGTLTLYNSNGNPTEFEPTVNLDTITYSYGARIVNYDDSVLQEALNPGKPLSHYQVSYQHIKAKQSANHTMIQRPTDPSGHDIDSSKHHFTEQLNIKRLIDGKQTTLYFDSAKERRY